MAEHPNDPDPSSPDRNPLGLGPRDAESANTGSIADTSYDARWSDPYRTGEPGEDASARETDPSLPADPDARSSDEP